MALIRCNHYSKALRLAMHLHAILPEDAPRGRKLPVLWLLHGMSDDDSIWQRRTSLERFVAKYELAVIMPNVHRSFYCNMRHGLAYWDYVAKELPELVGRLFPLSQRREETFVAGLSMGGYGALKLALNQPRRFAAAAALSPVIDLEARMRDEGSPVKRDLDLTFGEEQQRVPLAAHVLRLAERVAKRGPRPRLYLACGTEDHLYAHGVRFRDHARALGLDLTYDDGPGGHTWDYWDYQLPKVLAWLPLAPPARP